MVMVMIRFIDCRRGLRLSDYEGDLYLSPLVSALRRTAAQFLKMDGHRLFVVNSTEHGGGVAEMLPSQIALLQDLGLDARWVVIEPENADAFFNLTKRLHNALHGQGSPGISAEDKKLYDAVSRSAADALAPHLRPGDLLLVHDPQPAGMGAVLRREHAIHAIWRCHIGFDQRCDESDEAWSFLKPYVSTYDRTVFSLPEYAPAFLNGCAAVIPPAIDPLSHKNRELSVHKLTGILANAQLIVPTEPTLYPNFSHPAKRFVQSGRFEAASDDGEFGLLFRPVVTQISRWDRLKGFAPLLEAFIKLKQSPLVSEHPELENPKRTRRRISLVRLVLAGPDPGSVADDPEGKRVLSELCERWLELPSELQRDIAILLLPMSSRKQNALMVNALQRCSTIVVQNSLREGFGLTATEAMAKSSFVLASRAAGLRSQIDDGVHGRLINDANDPLEIANALRKSLGDPLLRTHLGRNARRRVGERYLIPSQLQVWIKLFAEVMKPS